MFVPRVSRRIQMLLAVIVSGIVLAGAAALRAADAPNLPDVKPDQLEKMQKALPEKPIATPERERLVLVYGNAQGFVHSSIPLGERTIATLGQQTGAFKAIVSNDPAMFDADKLKDFDAVILVSTTGHFMVPKGKDMKKASDDEKKAAEAAGKPYADAEKQRMQNLVDFVENQGKGLVGIHAATDAYYDIRGYGELIGGYFNGHPWNEKVGIKVEAPDSPLTAMFDKEKGIDIADEIYQFTPKGKDKEGRDVQTFSRERSKVLLSLDMTEGRTAPKGKSENNDFPVAWIHQAGKGRVFYCSLGHREEIYWNPTVLNHYLAGIQWALGDLKADFKPSSAKTAAE